MGYPPNKGKGAGIKFIRAHVTYAGDDCILWPQWILPNGYGTVSYLGKLYYAHRFMCEQAYGAPPSPTHEAAHCNNRACINPRHLSWKTRSENQLDRTKAGTQNICGWRWKPKLTSAERDWIVLLEGKATQRELAALFGVTFQNISHIQRKARRAAA